ncbi:MAG: DUF308 domain-containing protein [Victivallaceae bacterium]|nr:DUF308 domain-containing protein [Victivallaceae bacterium]
MTTISIFSNASSRTFLDFIIYRGILALVIGGFFVTMPETAATLICIILGLFLLVNGLLAVFRGLKLDENKTPLLIYGIICILAGIVILMQPILLKGLFVLIFALWVLISGGHQLVIAGKDKSNPPLARILTALTGLISILLGLALLFYPNIGLNLIVMLIGIYLVIFGVLGIATGSVIHRADKHAHTMIG